MPVEEGRAQDDKQNARAQEQDGHANPDLAAGDKPKAPSVTHPTDRQGAQAGNEYCERPTGSGSGFSSGFASSAGLNTMTSSVAIIRSHFVKTTLSTTKASLLLPRLAAPHLT